MKYNFKEELPSLLIVIATLALGWYFYHAFPSRIVTHWNFYGAPDAWGKGTTNAIAMPSLIVGMYILFLALPFLDPKKERYAEFKKVYSIFRTILLSVFFLIFFTSGLYNLGFDIKIQYVIPGIIGLLMIILGNYMGKIKQNWFVGIKTPWTMSSEVVWQKTHRVGGYAFIIFGILIFLTPLLPKVLGLIAFVFGVLLVTLGTFGYSYWLYRKEKNSRNASIQG